VICLTEIRDLLAAQVYTCEQSLSDVQIQFGCASDLMSDVLAFSRAGAVLLTGLVHLQTLQTAFIAEISAVVLVRGKRPTKEMMALATERRLPLLSSPYSMYEACGILYSRGLVSTMEPVPRGEHHAG
jgi:predicted transcriptional regulator